MDQSPGVRSFGSSKRSQQIQVSDYRQPAPQQVLVSNFRFGSTGGVNDSKQSRRIIANAIVNSREQLVSAVASNGCKESVKLRVKGGDHTGSR